MQDVVLHTDFFSKAEPRSFKRGNAQVLCCLKHNEPASMEPRSFKRGNEQLAAAGDEASIKLQWSHVHSNVETRRSRARDSRARRASMEPRSFKRGNVGGNGFVEFELELQWSHVHSNVETRGHSRGVNVSRRNASMEPRSFKRGNHHAAESAPPR